jgi:hypothetical protein
MAPEGTTGDGQARRSPQLTPADRIVWSPYLARSSTARGSSTRVEALYVFSPS